MPVPGMKVAVVTGASKGLGRELALALGRSGFHVAVNYHHSRAEAEEVLLGIGAHSVAVKADVASLRETEEMASKICEQWGGIDVLINNAGIAKDGLMIRYGEDDWDDVLRVNLKGCFNTVKVVAPCMVRAGGGHIINISSHSGLRGKAGQAAYSASKAAVVGFTYSLAKELGQHNIKVNAVLPGYMPTEMGRQAQDAMKKAREESILGRLSDPREVAGFITHLVTTETITGQVFCLDSRI
jgi:3-oxoacyl-[acyl-carrier protein] reductase